MIFIDTNYFLRFLRDDVQTQSAVVKELFIASAQGKKELFTSTIVFFEIYWVMSSFYKHDKKSVISILQKILQLHFIEIEDRKILAKSLQRFSSSSVELEDCYNLEYAKSRKMTSFATFDKKLLKQVE